MFGTHLFAHSEGIMRAQPGGSNHNLRVSGTQCVDGVFHLSLIMKGVMVGFTVP